MRVDAQQRTRSRYSAVTLALLGCGLLLGLGGCATTGAPDDWLPPVMSAASDPFGAWIHVTCSEVSWPSREGEFIAVGADSIYVLRAHTLHAIPREKVTRARLAFFDPGQKAAGWSAAGALSTLSHGLVLVISLPFWLAGGLPIANLHTKEAIALHPEKDWPELRQYARFPQGPPLNIHRLQLRSKSIEERHPPKKPII
ncbi:MAG: hypothetical protein ABIF77_04375 [bacterium]